MTDENYHDRGFCDEGPEEEVNHDTLGIEWDDVTFVNPPFLRVEFKQHEKKVRGLTVFVRKAIAQAQKNKTIAMVLPVHRIITLLLVLLCHK
jgi:hypothetical protein